MEQQLNLMIIEDHEIIVWALTSIIEKYLPNSNTTSISSFPEGVDLLRDGYIDLIILDIKTPGGGTPKMITDLRQIQSDVKILIHTGLPEEEYAVQYLQEGANGFLSKNAPYETIIEAIRHVLSGRKYISPAIHRIIAENFLAPNEPSHKKLNFEVSEREKGVIRLLLKGKWNKEIADELELKQTTISTHKGRIFEKFDVTNPIELYIKIQKIMPELLI